MHPIRIVAAVATLVAASFSTGQAAQAPPPSANLDDYLALVRSNIQARKSHIIRATLALDDAQGAAFWPVYQRYEVELAAILEERYAAIKDYAAHFDTLTDAKAADLTDRAITLESKRLDLIKHYVDELRGVLPATKVGRWYQIETALNRAVDLKVASEIPLAPTVK
jgi:hypothetical protein